MAVDVVYVAKIACSVKRTPCARHGVSEAGAGVEAGNYAPRLALIRRAACAVRYPSLHENYATYSSPATRRRALAKAVCHVIDVDREGSEFFIEWKIKRWRGIRWCRERYGAEE